MSGVDESSDVGRLSVVLQSRPPCKTKTKNVTLGQSFLIDILVLHQINVKMIL